MPADPLTRPFAALIGYLYARAQRLDVEPADGARCYAWAESLERAISGEDPQSPLRPAHMKPGLDDDDTDTDPDIDDEDDVDLYFEMRDLVSDALGLLTGTIGDHEREGWIRDARAALGEDHE